MQVRAVGCDQAAPDTVLANVPVPQRQLQALGPYGTTGADGDRGRCLVAGPGRLDTDRVPLVGVKAAVSAPGLPGAPGTEGIAGQLLGGKAAGHGDCLTERSGAQAVAGSRGAPAWRPGARRRGRRRPGPAAPGSPAVSPTIHARAGRRGRSPQVLVVHQARNREAPATIRGPDLLACGFSGVARDASPATSAADGGQIGRAHV